ncbi:hypothetical protein CBL_00638 [Carabus blaptoides fortunei]
MDVFENRHAGTGTDTATDIEKKAGSGWYFYYEDSPNATGNARENRNYHERRRTEGSGPNGSILRSGLVKAVMRHRDGGDGGRQETSSCRRRRSKRE